MAFKSASAVGRTYFFGFSFFFMVLIPVIVPYWQSLGLSMREIYQIQAIFGVVMVAMDFPTGYLADLWGRKRTLLVGAFLIGIGTSLFLVAHNFWSLVFLEVILGVGSSLISGSDIAILYDSASHDPNDRSARTHAVANYQLAQVSGEATASFLGAWLATHSFQWAVWGHALAGWGPFLVALTLKEPTREFLARGQHRKNFAELIRHVFRGDPLLRLIFISLVSWGLMSFFVVWSLQKFWQEAHVPLAWFGLLWAAMNLSAGFMGKQVHGLEKRLGPWPVAAFIGASTIFGYLGMASLPIALAVACGFFVYAARGVNQVLLRDAYNWRIPPRFRASANSLQSSSFRLSFAVLGPLFGFLIDRQGVRAAYGVLGLVAAALVPLTLWPIGKHLRGMRAR